MVNRSPKKRQRNSSLTSEDDSSNEYQVEEILDKRIKGKRTEYLLKWKGYSDDHNTVKSLIFSFTQILWGRSLT